MTESMDPQTPEETAALRALAATHRRRWVALLPSVAVSFFTTAILYVIWHNWPLDGRARGKTDEHLRENPRPVYSPCPWV
jgi:hypothetical protein